MTSDLVPVDGGGLVLDSELVDERQAVDLLDVSELGEDQLIDRWLRKQKSPRTREAYERDLGYWLAFLDEHGVDVLRVRGRQVEEYDAWLRSTPLPATGRVPAPSTVARRLATVSSFYLWLVRKEVVPRNPVDYVDRPDSDPDFSPTSSLTEDESRRFVLAAFGLATRASNQDVRRAADRDAVVVAVMLTTGLRVSEVCSLKVEDLSYDRGHRVVKVTRKGGKRASVVLGAAAELVDRRVQGRTSGPLFVSRSGKPLFRTWVFQVVRRVAIDAAIPDPQRITPHSLRHTYATLALDREASLEDLQDALGHADPRTTRRYDRARNRVDRSPSLVLGRVLLKGDPDRTGHLPF